MATELFETIFSFFSAGICLLPILIYGSICIFGLASFAIWIFMLLDCLKREFKKSDERLVWILVVLLTGIIGAILYYFLIKRPDKH